MARKDEYSDIKENEKVETVFSETTSFEGILKFNTSIKIEGNFKGKIMNAFSPEYTYQGVEPDILIGSEFDLIDFGIKSRIVHTPGHTEGSITIVLDNGEMIVGDLVRGKEPNITLGQFYEDKTVLLQSLEMIADYHAKRIYMSHGNYIDNSTLQKCISKLHENS